MLMHALVYVFLLAFIAITPLGHMRLALASIRACGGAHGWTAVCVELSRSGP